MKIVFVMNEFEPSAGGAMGVAGDEISALVARGHDVSVFAGMPSRSSGASETQADWSGAHITRIPTRDVRWALKPYIGLRNRPIEARFRAFLAQMRPDVVHFHNIYYHFPFSLVKIARRSCPRVFYTAHDVMAISPGKLFHFVSASDAPIRPSQYRLSLFQEWRQNKKAFNPLRRFGIRHYLKSATRILAVSDELKKTLEANGIHNVAVLHNSLDPGRYPYDAADKAVIAGLKDKFGLKGRKVIMTAGRLSVLKGGIAAVDILAETKKAVPEAALLVLADTENSKMMKERALTLGVADAIVTVHSVPRAEMPLYYGLSDVVMMPSLCLDTFGMVALEAMACGKPVVVTCFGGAREMVEIGANGSVENPLRTSEFSARIAEILSDPARAAAMGRRSRAIVEERFALVAHVQKLLGYYAA